MKQLASELAHDLESMFAIVAATLDLDGTLIRANAGFLRIIKAEAQYAIGAPAARYFQQPNFTSLNRAAAGSDGEVYRGLLSIGDHMETVRTLRARVWRRDGKLQVLAEYDVEEMEQLNDKILTLNCDYADAQFKLAQINLKLQQREAQIVALTLTDPLTGVGNRRRLQQALVTEISRAQRTEQKLCAFMADLDHFKLVNDNFGHEAGDKVLSVFGELLREQTRATETVARTGGEEFVVLMPHTDLAQGLATAERIRGALAALRIESVSQSVTASFGVAELARGEDGVAFMRRIDSALYQAKHSGRNRVVAG